uniref:Uncharacterized protein n=1 Tax=Oryza glumipatula TaxID=40148 RepID=A0A0E0AWG9_9ORYZ
MSSASPMSWMRERLSMIRSSAARERRRAQWWEEGEAAVVAIAAAAADLKSCGAAADAAVLDLYPVLEPVVKVGSVGANECGEVPGLSPRAPPQDRRERERERGGAGAPRKREVEKGCMWISSAIACPVVRVRGGREVAAAAPPQDHRERGEGAGDIEEEGARGVEHVTRRPSGFVG